MPKAVSQPSPKVLACRANGKKGGLSRAKKRTAAEIKAWSAKGGKKTLDTYGSDYYGFILSKTRTVGRNKKPRVKPKKKKAVA